MVPGPFHGAYRGRSPPRRPEISASLGGRAGEITAHLGGHVDRFERTVVARLGAAGEQISGKAREIDEMLLARSAAVTEELTANADRLDETLGVRASEITARLGGHIDLFERNVVARLGQSSARNSTAASARSSETVDGRGGALDDELRARTAELHECFELARPEAGGSPHHARRRGRFADRGLCESAVGASPDVRPT